MGDPTDVVVVTGAGSGIGRSAAEALADAGHVVVALGRRAEKLRGYHTIGRIEGWVCDVTDPSQVAQVATRARAEIGPVVGLVNAAGTIAEAPVGQLSLESLRHQMRTNVEGTLIPIQALLPALREHGGSIVNFSSMLTRRPLAGTGGYAATKGAVEALTKVLALELAPDRVRCNVVLPSLVRSDIYVDAGMAPSDYERMLVDLQRIFPLGRVGEPRDVAGIVRFLISEESSWMTGCEVNVDGGRGVGP